MKITIACVGRLKEKYLTEAAAEYAKRLSRYCTLEWLETADEKTPEGASSAEEDAIRNKEGQRLLKGIPDQAYVIALAILGKEMDSVAFARLLEQQNTAGVSHIVFVIGGSLGLSDAVLARADLQLSFSRMTFPHQLMRVILLEQIYRSFRIRHHEPYHK